MVIKNSKIGRFLDQAAAVLICILLVTQIETSIAWASDTSDNIVIPASKLSEDANGFCSLQLEVPDFDQMTISWTSTEDPLISVRIKDSETDQWGDWQPIVKNGQSYLHRMGGLFSFQKSEYKSHFITIEICAEKKQAADLEHITLSFSKSKQDNASTVVMIVVMMAAGCVLYVKKRKEILL